MHCEQCQKGNHGQCVDAGAPFRDALDMEPPLCDCMCEEADMVPGAAPVRTFSIQPGNGYRYDLLVVGPIMGETSLGVCGSVTNGYLVVLGYNGASYLFQDNHNVLAAHYVAEKLNLGITSAKYVTRLLGEALDRPVMGCE